MNIDPEIDDGGLRFSEEKYYQQTDSDGEESDIANVTEDCDDYKEEAKSNIEKGDSGKFVEDKIGMDSNKCVNDLEEGVKVGGLRAVFETDWFLHLEGKNMKTLKLEDIEDISFRNLDEAEQFYSYYGFIMGFSIRKNKMDKLVVNGVEVVVRRSWNCSKEGYCKQLRNNKQPPFEYEEGGKIKRNVFSDKCKGKKKAVFREIKYSRSGCRALLWVKLNKKSGLYHVSKFVTDHNHELAQVSERYLLRSNRHVLIQDIYEVQALREAQVSTSAAYDYLLKQSGGAEFVGFLLKDLYNRLDAEKKINKQHGDAEAAVNWMRLKGQEDPLFFARYTKDAEGRLSSLFWRDHTSLLDYETYGDVLIVDSTYKTNIYGMPFVMFVGANNHRGTVLFGCALVCDEKEETFSWLIEKFLESMDNIPPKAIVTDGDEAMRNAMIKLMPNARHRLCAWHIGRNVCQNMKNVEVQKKLGQLIYASYSVPEWEEEWKCMIIGYGLEDSSWMTLLYDKRERWAEAFCKGHFYGGICSTQRCEGMNSKAKKLVGRFTTLNCFVRRFGRSIDRLRDRVCLDNFKSKNHTRNFNTHMKSIEEEAFKTFTDDIFLVIKGQIMLESRFFVSSRILFGDCKNTMVYVGQYDQPSRSWLVECTSDSIEGDVTYECNCKLFESDGIPCCHIFSVLKSDRVMAYPKSLICKRWEKSGPDNITRSKSCLLSDDKASQVMRYTALIGAAKRVCHNMSQSAEGFDKMMAELGMLEENSFNYRSMKKAKLNLKGSENVVGDPVKARTKGMQGKIPLTNNGNGGEPPKCSICGLPGHNLRTCALNPDVSKGKRAKSVAQSDGTRAAEDHNLPRSRTPPRSVANEVNEESLEVPWPSGVHAQMQPSLNFGFDLHECTGNVMCYVPDLNSQVEESGQG